MNRIINSTLEPRHRQHKFMLCLATHEPALLDALLPACIPTLAETAYFA